MMPGRSSNESFGGGTSAPRQPRNEQGAHRIDDPLRQVRTIL